MTAEQDTPTTVEDAPIVTPEPEPAPAPDGDEPVPNAEPGDADQVEPAPTVEDDDGGP